MSFCVSVPLEARLSASSSDSKVSQIMHHRMTFMSESRPTGKETLVRRKLSATGYNYMECLAVTCNITTKCTVYVCVSVQG